MSWRPNLKRRSWQFIAEHRDVTLLRGLARFSKGYLRAFEGSASYLIDCDGEQRVIETIAAHGTGHVFDVGANVGEWSELAGAIFSNEDIHSFEPVQATHRQLVTRLQPLGNRSTVVNAALSDNAGTAEINTRTGQSAHASLQTMGDGTETVALLRGDDYCSDHGIESIRFLKIDTEGWDHRVLLGFQQMLAKGQIDCVQFEYGPWALNSRFLLKDFYALFSEHGMCVGKIYPNSVDFGTYRSELEDFRGLNFLAVQETEIALVRALSNS